jgi:hypothetical protein
VPRWANNCRFVGLVMLTSSGRVNWLMPFVAGSARRAGRAPLPTSARLLCQAREHGDRRISARSGPLAIARTSARGRPRLSPLAVSIRRATPRDRSWSTSVEVAELSGGQPSGARILDSGAGRRPSVAALIGKTARRARPCPRVFDRPDSCRCPVRRRSCSAIHAVGRERGPGPRRRRCHPRGRGVWGPWANGRARYAARRGRRERRPRR